MPIVVTDDQGVEQEICPAACYDGLFDPDNMSQEQIDAICGLFNCGPLDVDALATALFLLCDQLDDFCTPSGVLMDGDVVQACVDGDVVGVVYEEPKQLVCDSPMLLIDTAELSFSQLPYVQTLGFPGSPVSVDAQCAILRVFFEVDTDKNSANTYATQGRVYINNQYIGYGENGGGTAGGDKTFCGDFFVELGASKNSVTVRVEEQYNVNDSTADWQLRVSYIGYA